MAAKLRITKKFIVQSLIIFLVIVLGLTGIDYKSYKNGDRSVLFGTLNVYSQNQILKFDSLNVQVTGLSTESTDGYVMISYQYSNTGNLPLNMSSYKISVINNNSSSNSNTGGFCGNSPSGQLLKGDLESQCIAVQYSGDPLALSVIHNGKQKIINIDTSKVK